MSSTCKWLSLLLAFTLAGCSHARMARLASTGRSHHIKQFSGGQLVGEWNSVGQVLSEEQSDGWSFEDARTHTIVLVSGTVQITVN